MPATAYVTISGTVQGAPAGSKQIGPFLIVNPASGDATTPLSSANGDNTINVPAGGSYTGCVIQPPVTNTLALKLKGAGGDTGIPIHPSQPTLLSLPSGATSFILNVGGSGVAIEVTWF